MALALLDALIETFSVAPPNQSVSGNQNKIKTYMDEIKAMSRKLIQSIESDLGWSDIPISERNDPSYYRLVMECLQTYEWKWSNVSGVESLMETNRTDKK